MKKLLLVVIGWALFALLPYAYGQTIGLQNAILCNKSASYDNSATRQIIITGQTLQNPAPIFICGYLFNTNANMKMQLVAGTGTTCQTGTITVTPSYQLSPQVQDLSPMFRGMFVPSSNDVCVVSNTTQPGQAIIYYSQQTQ